MHKSISACPAMQQRLLLQELPCTQHIALHCTGVVWSSARRRMKAQRIITIHAAAFVADVQCRW
jgi:hypothetical protein